MISDSAALQHFELTGIGCRYMFCFTRFLFALHAVSALTITTSFCLSRSYTLQRKLSTTQRKMTSSDCNNVVIVRVKCDETESTIYREGIAQLFKLYFDELYSLGCDLGFQGFHNEWVDLPGKYDFNKRGGLFVAVLGQEELKSAEQIVGCIALRQLDENCGEVKRMFIRKAYRRSGVGNKLAKAVIAHAWDQGYSEIKLDTLERLVRLYALLLTS